MSTSDMFISFLFGFASKWLLTFLTHKMWNILRVPHVNFETFGCFRCVFADSAFECFFGRGCHCCMHPTAQTTPLNGAELHTKIIMVLS